MTIIITLFLVFSMLHHHYITATSSPPITALYVFGDSTVDPGNNNHIPTARFRANHKPYGSSFPGQVPTGRFTDGRLVPDYIADSLGLKQFIPAYLDPAGLDRELLTGVSFASAGSGLDDQTFKISKALDLETQVRYFKEAVNQMEGRVEKEKVNRTVGNAMFLISVGTNDMTYNYFDFRRSRAVHFSPSEYADFLVGNLRLIIERMYKLGGRRFAVAGLPPVGCLPLQVTLGNILNGTHWLQRRCIEKQNAVCRLYNEKLQVSLTDLQSKYSQARFVYADIYTPLVQMINHPSSYSFERTVEGCCGTGIVEGGILCNALSPRCRNPRTYVFWDSIHPTDAAYKILAKSIETNVVPKLLMI